MPILGAIILIAVGVVLAFMGKRFIWLLVGAAGFIITYDILTLLIPGNGLFQLGVAIVAGLVVGWLATRFTKILLMIAAGLLIANLGYSLAVWFGGGFILTLILMLIGAAIGVAILRFFAGPAIAAIAAIGGGAMVGNGVALLLYGSQSGGTWVPTLVTIVVAVVGFVYQMRSESTDKAATA